MLDYIRNAKVLSGLKFNNEDYKYDLLKSVCILINDGTTYTYSLRSFQEYFSSHSISFFNFDRKQELLSKFLRKSALDKVLFLAFEMNTSNIEQNLIIPMGKDYIKKYELASDEKAKLTICFKSIHATYTPGREKHAYYVNEETDYWYFLTYFENIYSQKYKSYAPKYKNTLSKKKFKEIFGTKKVDEYIPVTSIGMFKLRKIGVCDIQEKRVSFLKNILFKIENRNKELTTNLEAFL